MKNKCPSSRGPSEDMKEERQDLGQRSIPSLQKAVAKSNEYLLYSEYFKDIPIVFEDTIKNDLTQNGIAYDSIKGK